MTDPRRRHAPDEPVRDRMPPRSVADTFSSLRPTLFRIAYRMLGAVADAEDIVQETYLRWSSADHAEISDPVGYLRTVATRLSINETKKARRKRETYIGPWLPDPIVADDEASDPDDITFHLMVALERLSPLERAAFLLHDVFGLSFDAVAQAISREPAACRKLASRARNHIQSAKPRFPVSKEQGSEIAAAFFVASRTGNLDTLRSLLADEVVAYADGGGKVPASPHPLIGLEEVMERHAQLARHFVRSPSRLVRHATMDGLRGFVTIEDGPVLQVTALQMSLGKITSIYVIRNPDKLGHLNDPAGHAATTESLGDIPRSTAATSP